MYACDWWEYIHEEYISGKKYVPVGESTMLKFQSGFAGWEISRITGQEVQSTYIITSEEYACIIILVTRLVL